MILEVVVFVLVSLWGFGWGFFASLLGFFFFVSLVWFFKGN